MLKQIYLLTKIQLLNTGGFNQIRYGKDKKKRNNLILMLSSYLFVGLIFAAYMGIISFGMVLLGMGDMVPAVTAALVSVVVLFFTMIKAGSVIFEMKTYDMMVSLPVSPTAIVVSRFLNMYVMDVLFGFIIMLPSAIISGVMMGKGIGYYLLYLIGILLVPLLPLTIATAVGALITAVSSRMKHKNLVTIVMTIGVTLVIILLSLSLSGTATEITITEEILGDLLEMVESQIFGMYPPARLFMEAVSYGNLLSGLLFLLVSACPFLLLIALVQKEFLAISSILYTHKSGAKYEMQELYQLSPVKALYKKELARYFSSSIYVLNTLIIYLIMILLAAAVAVFGAEKVEEIMEFPGIVTKAMPFLLAMFGCMSSTTNCTISMEGKEWWLSLSLPIRARQLFDGKMMVNLTVALPCYLISEILLLFSLKGSVLDMVWLILVPLAYILLFTVFGITINSKMPVFKWEKEETAVKQGGALLIAMLIAMVSTIIPMIAVFIIPAGSQHLLYGIITCLVLAVTCILYVRNSRVDLRTLDD